MADHVPQLEPKMLERIAALRGLPAVEAAFEVCAEEVERAMAEQIRISETESPTFAEKVRGELIMELLREYGLTGQCGRPTPRHGRWSGARDRRSSGYGFPCRHGSQSDKGRRALPRARYWRQRFGAAQHAAGAACA